MVIERIAIPGLALNSYLIGDEETRECAVLDPARDADLYISFAKQNGFNITHILETHVHADFVSGALELKARLEGRPKIHSSGMGGKNWTPIYADHVVLDGDKILMGQLMFLAVHTPGHTPEHLMWVLYEQGELQCLFTGDFVFVGDVGRPDLLGKEEMEKLSDDLYESVFHRLNSYPDSTEIRPSHGAGSLCGKSLGSNPTSTLGFERKNNRSMQKKERGSWIKELMLDMPAIPKYFPRMKRINIKSPKIIGETLPGNHALSPERCQQEVNKGAIVLDVRSKEYFAEAHVPQSISIPISPAFSTWAGWVLPEDHPIILVLNHPEELESVVKTLIRIGFDTILGYLQGGIQGWKAAGMEISTLKAITSDELFHLKDKEKVPFLLDIRTDREWKEGHIDGAVHLFGGVVQENLHSIPRDCPITVICGSGYRASVISSILLKEGFGDVTNVFGGMQHWIQAGHPTVK